MEGWEETIKGKGELILKGNKEEPCNVDFEIEQSFNGQLRISVKPEGITGVQLFKKICEAQEVCSHGIRVTLKGELEEGFKLDTDLPLYFLQGELIDGARFGRGVSFFPKEIEITRDFPFSERKGTVYYYDLVNGMWDLHEIKIGNYHFKLHPFTTSSEQHTLDNFSVNLLPSVNTYILFEKWENEKELRDFVNDILNLLSLASGSNVEWTREIKAYTHNGEGKETKIVFRNCVADRPNLSHPIIKFPCLSGYLEKCYKALSKMCNNDRNQFVLALHFLLKSKSEIKIENRLINALISLEILSKKEGCRGCKKGFHIECLEELLNNLNISYEFPGLKEIGRINGVRGKLFHRGVFPKEAVGCSPAEFLFIIHTLVDEILLRKLDYSNIFCDAARGQMRIPGSKR